MKTKWVKVKLYSFDELSEHSKEKVRYNYLTFLSSMSDVFVDNCQAVLCEEFPNSSLEIEYNLGYTQNDGLNIYGYLSLVDAIELIKDKLKKKEYRFMQWVLREFSDSIKLNHNWRGCFCIADRYNYLDNVICDLECTFMRAIPYDTLEKVNNLIAQLLTNLCNEFLEYGYEFFYPNSLDDDIAEWAEEYGYEFTEDGRIFKG